MGDKKGYKKLIVWEKADGLAKKVYEATKSFPKEEIYGITSQLRRACLSIPINLAEGQGRQNQKEMKHFVNIALGSLAETEYLLSFSKDLGFISSFEYNEIEQDRCSVGKLLYGLYKKL